MAGPLAPKLALARAAGALSRLRGGEATSVPGKVLLRLEPRAIGLLGARLERGSVLISATNGKTTTAAMAASILAGEGVTLVHNRAGANMAGGIASTLLDAASSGGAIAGELGLFEVDELWLEEIAAQLHPRAILLGNLFRDQLDRYGELETIAERWAATVRDGPGRGARSCSTPMTPWSPTSAASASERPLLRGATTTRSRSPAWRTPPTPSTAATAAPPTSSTPSTLGTSAATDCPACGQARPAPAVSATDVRLEGVRAARFTLHTPDEKAEVALPLPGLYNVYNALAAAALAYALEFPWSASSPGWRAPARRSAAGRA